MCPATTTTKCAKILIFSSTHFGLATEKKQERTFYQERWSLYVVGAKKRVGMCWGNLLVFIETFCLLNTLLDSSSLPRTFFRSPKVMRIDRWNSSKALQFVVFRLDGSKKSFSLVQLPDFWSNFEVLGEGKRDLRSVFKTDST